MSTAGRPGSGGGDEARNLLLLGPLGIARPPCLGLGVLVAEADKRVHFTSAVELSRLLLKRMEPNTLRRELNFYTQPPFSSSTNSAISRWRRPARA